MRKFWIIILLLILSGCTAQKASDIEVIWHSGECLFVADGLTLEQAAEMRRQWSLDHCSIQIDSATQKNTP